MVATPTAARLGRYEVIKHLASGGMAEVLLARAAGIEGFERYVVIKRIHVERARDPHVVKMFCDEARLAASMHHHNIVQVHDIGQEKGEYFFAMEYLHGEDLRRLLTTASRKNVKIPTEHVLSIVTAAAAALHYAHDHKNSSGAPLNIVHRDVSPANILVGYDGEVKVVDFGIAKASFRSAETQSGTLKGKISYMAPEQCLGAAVDRRSDVFALGIVLFELTTVRRLFKGASDFLTMSAIVAGNTPKPSTYRPDTPPELEAIIMKALAHKPEDRFQSANELRIALEEYASKAQIRYSTTSLGEYMTTLLGRRPEPWLLDAEDAEIEIADVDFDGPANNTPNSSRTPTGMPTPPPGSLFARVRRKMAPAGGVEVTPFPEPPKEPVVVAPPAGGWGVDDRQPTMAAAAPVPTWTPETPTGSTSGTAMAWSPGTAGSAVAAPVGSARKHRGLVLGVVAALSLGALLLLRPWAGGDKPSASVESASVESASVESASVESATVESASASIALEPLPRPEPLPSEPITEPAIQPPLATIEEVGEASIAASSGALARVVELARGPSTQPKRVALKKSTTKPGPAKPKPDKPRYDPKSLFPK